MWPKKKGKLNEYINGVPIMITLSYDLQTNELCLPLGFHYRENMVDECGTLDIDREDDLPSIFDA